MKTARLFATAALILTTAPAFAQSELDRLEVATVAAGANLEAFFVSRAPSLAAVMPEWAWDEEMRTAATCTLDAIRVEGGDAAVTSYVEAMEVFSTVQITSMDQLAIATPVPINADFAAQTGQTCGSAEIGIRRMQESGFMEAMMNPEVMISLMN